MGLEKMELSGGARLSSQPCRECQKYFIFWPEKLPGEGAFPKLCSTCQDVRQGRPSVAVERREIAVYDAVEIVGLPSAEWQEFQGTKTDSPAYKIDVRGKEFGADWNGRIIIYAARPYSVGEIVSIRHMEVVHRVKAVSEERQTVYGKVDVEKILPVTAEEGDEKLFTGQYLVLEEAKKEVVGKLVWAEAHTKTTIKGFGRQYWAEVSGQPLAEWRVNGGVRSGRAHTTGVLAIVSEDYPLVIQRTGDIKGEVVYR